VTRINQFLAAATGLSRRAADAAVQAGRVTINGQTAILGDQVGTSAVVQLDGRTITPSSHRTYLMLHKPVGYVSSRSRQGADPTIYDLLPPEYHTLRPAGRLDRDSSGLMLLSDDGDFIQAHTHPSHHKTKLYELTLARKLTPADATRLEAGVELTDGPSRLSIIAGTGTRHVTVSLSEGRNRQLRRTFGALGYTVEALHRTAIGTHQLGELPSGQFQIIQHAQVPSQPMGTSTSAGQRKA
jgi:23S rRNA pseudouridine2605 synthase